VNLFEEFILEEPTTNLSGSGKVTNLMPPE